MPIPMKPARVHYLVFGDGDELAAVLRELATRVESVDDDVTPIVIAVPDSLRRFLDWPASSVPQPQIHGDALVFVPGLTVQ